MQLTGSEQRGVSLYAVALAGTGLSSASPELRSTRPTTRRRSRLCARRSRLDRPGIPHLNTAGTYDPHPKEEHVREATAAPPRSPNHPNQVHRAVTGR